MSGILKRKLEEVGGTSPCSCVWESDDDISSSESADSGSNIHPSPSNHFTRIALCSSELLLSMDHVAMSEVSRKLDGEKLAYETIQDWQPLFFKYLPPSKTSVMAEFHGKFAAMPRPEFSLEEFAWARFVDLTKEVTTNHLFAHLKVSAEAFRAAAAVAHK